MQQSFPSLFTYQNLVYSLTYTEQILSQKRVQFFVICKSEILNTAPPPNVLLAIVLVMTFLNHLLLFRLRWQREAGILDRLWKIWVTQHPICEDNLGGFVSVGLIDFYPALKTLHYGIMTAIVVFLGEIVYFYR